MNSGELNASPYKPPSIIGVLNPLFSRIGGSRIKREVDAEGRRERIAPCLVLKELTKNLSLSFRKRKQLPHQREPK